MKRLIALALACAWLLTACSGWATGEYISVEPHPTHAQISQEAPESVKNYGALCAALKNMIHNNSISGKISVEEYDRAALEKDIPKAIDHIMSTDAIAAYAVESISYELGNMGNRRAVRISISYHPNRSDPRRMPSFQDMDQANELIYQALDNCDAGIAFQVESYTDTDFALLVESYAEEYPQRVMEQPKVIAHIYPEAGEHRVVELVFTYQTNRESLRQMKEYVAPVFQASRLNVAGEETQSSQFSRMYSFLAERNTIQLASSITPAYSLLRYGVGDSKSFALVFAAMCRNANLECRVVSGTKDGQSHFWNMICQDGVHYHVDLLRNNPSQDLIRYTDSEMAGYVWDFDDYPACNHPQANNLQEE